MVLAGDGCGLTPGRGEPVLLKSTFQNQTEGVPVHTFPLFADPGLGLCPMPKLGWGSSGGRRGFVVGGGGAGSLMGGAGCPASQVFRF